MDFRRPNRRVRIPNQVPPVPRTEPSFIFPIRPSPGTPNCRQGTFLHPSGCIPDSPAVTHALSRQSPWLRDQTNLPNTPATLQVWPRPLQSPFNPFASPLPPHLVSTPIPTWWDPGTFPPHALENAAETPLRIHPHLIYNPLDANIPLLQWDVITPPESARVYTGRQVIVPVNRKEAAIHLPGAAVQAHKLWIGTDHAGLSFWMDRQRWGPIMVEKSKITVLDIMDAIYAYFQQPLTRADFRLLKRANPENMSTITYTAHQRAWEGGGLYGVNVKEGFLRADVLGGHRRWMGMRGAVFADGTWKVFMGLMPGPVPRVC